MAGVALQDTRRDWEKIWAPYDETTYRAVLDQIESEDIVLDIGAGDLRLTRRLMKKCQKVYAIEIQETLLNQTSQEVEDRNSKNLHIIHGDARYIQFPPDVTAGVLLMRHCTHFQLYASKLKQVGAERLITNARWRMGVEVVQLQARRIPFQEMTIGWYACWCGKVGFKSGPVEQIPPKMINLINEVINCPHCETTINFMHI
jgi:predicted RNA methylase